MAKNKTIKEGVIGESTEEQIKRLQAENDKLNNNLNMLKLYFRDYRILEHYMAWIQFKAKDRPDKPKALTLVK